MSDAFIRMSYSDDGGYNWSNWQAESIGEVGEYEARPVFTRLGQFRTRIIHLQVSSPRKRDILGAVAALQGTIG